MSLHPQALIMKKQHIYPLESHEEPGPAYKEPTKPLVDHPGARFILLSRKKVRGSAMILSSWVIFYGGRTNSS